MFWLMTTSSTMYFIDPGSTKLAPRLSKISSRLPSSKPLRGAMRARTCGHSSRSEACFALDCSGGNFQYRERPSRASLSHKLLSQGALAGDASVKAG